MGQPIRLRLGCKGRINREKGRVSHALQDNSLLVHVIVYLPNCLKFKEVRKNQTNYHPVGLGPRGIIPTMGMRKREKNMNVNYLSESRIARFVAHWEQYCRPQCRFQITILIYCMPDLRSKKQVNGSGLVQFLNLRSSIRDMVEHTSLRRSIEGVG